MAEGVRVEALHQIRKSVVPKVMCSCSDNSDHYLQPARHVKRECSNRMMEGWAGCSREVASE